MVDFLVWKTWYEMNLKKILILFVLMFGVACACSSDREEIIKDDFKPVKNAEKQTVENTSQQDFQIFWESFRVAAINKDFKSLSQFAEFPIRVRGGLDTDPTELFVESKFGHVLHKVLNQSSFEMDEKGNLEETTFLEELRRMEKLSVHPGPDQTFMQVKQFQFELKNKHWKLVEVYIE